MSGCPANLPRTHGPSRRCAARTQHPKAFEAAKAGSLPLTLFSLSLFAVSGCANSSSKSCAGHVPSPSGDPAEYELRAGGSVQGVAVAAPLMCEHDQAYIRIERTAGARRLGIGRDDGGGFNDGCLELPEVAADPSQCPVIDHGAILRAAVDEMRARGLFAHGQGAGPCADTSTGDYEKWNMSTKVVSWSDADEAVNIVAGLLVEYDLRGFVGVAVRGLDCAEAD